MKSEANERVPLRQLVVFGAGGLIPIALFNIAGQLIGLIGNISLGLSAFWLGVILIIPRVWDAVSDPVVGHLSDNTNTRWGRRRPYVLVGGIAVALSFMLMWWVPKYEAVQAWIPNEAAFQWFQLFYILVSVLIFFTATTLFEIPHGALGMEITTNSHERTRLFSAKSFFGNLFAMATPWLFALAGMEIFKGPGGTEADGMRYVSILIALFLIPASVWWFIDLKEPAVSQIKTKENKERSKFWTDMRYIVANRNFLYLVVTVFTLAMGFNFVSLLNYYISIFYIYGGDKAAAGPLLGINGTIWAITGLLAVFPLNWISPKMGKRNTLLLSIALMCTAQIAKIFCYNPEYPYLMVIPTVLLSAGMLFFFTLGTSMLGDVCDEDDLKTGKRAEGSYYSVYWWFIKMGTAFASLVTGLLIIFTQFDETQVTRVDELRGSINEIRVQAGKDASMTNKTLIELFNKADRKAESLRKHLQVDVQGSLADSTHREMLLKNLEVVSTELKSITAMQRVESIPPSITSALSQLTLQTPKSLFMMRLIEISLPIFLSVISLIFALRYPLTSDRSQEIQEALKKRNNGLLHPRH